MEDIIHDGNVTLILSKGVSVYAETEKPKARPTSPLLKESSSGEVIAPWGDSNDFPQQIIKIASVNPEIPTLLDNKVRVTYAKGIFAAKITGYDNNQNEILEVIKDDEMARWFRVSQFNRYLLEALTDFYWFFNAFPELIISRDRSIINQISVNAAESCRWEKMNSSGISQNIFVNANFPNAKATDPETTKIPVIDPYDVNKVQALKEKSNVFKVVYPINYPTPGKTYYQLAHWDSIRSSGWLEVAALIPKYKLSKMKNQMSLKYHIEIPYEYWSNKYKDWETKPNLKESRKQEESERLNKFLTDVENTGKSIITEFSFDKITGKEFPGWKIKTIGAEEQKGTLLEDAQEASSYLMRALGVDPAIVGAGPGKNIGAGSGSDKRVAFNIYVSLLQTYRDAILEPLQFIADYNGWYDKHGENLVFRFRETNMQEPQQQAK